MKHNPLFVMFQFDMAYQFLYGVFRCCQQDPFPPRTGVATTVGQIGRAANTYVRF